MAFTSLSYSFLYFSTNSPSSFFSAKLCFPLPLNECFSHFNVQQLSSLKHKSFCFVFTSSFKNNIENENIRKNLFHSILLNSEYYKVGPNNSGGGGGSGLKRIFIIAIVPIGIRPKRSVNEL